MAKLKAKNLREEDLNDKREARKAELTAFRWLRGVTFGLEIAKICGHCNDKKTAAKTVSEASADTFFGLFVKHVGTLEEKGVVVAVLDASFDVLVFKYGVVKRVYVNRLDMARDPEFHENAAPPRLTLYWKSKDGVNPIVVQEITICTVVDVVLSALPEPTKYQAVIKMQPTAEAPKLSDLLAANVEKLGTDGEASISNEDNVLDMRAETIFADLGSLLCFHI
ncbi:unnamed protein product, partial [Mesorhabditis belari]|uniref:DIS3-like exonuclease 2 C-terminal domain-containing protein n=1 Tax=Mesorhabditis belari TaxID=2138241 RepID=A0AAF3F412_9BILA